MEILDRITELSKFVDKTDVEQRLARMSRLLELMGHPEDKLKVIHVAGTNGKGSCCHFIKSLLEAEGYRVGMFTSPHVMNFEERFQIGQEQITPEEFEEYAEKVLAYNEVLKKEGYGNTIRFEILTCVAYLFFNDRTPDYVIMEAGIGGRTDPTNSIAKPEIAVITQVGIDHVYCLGNTVEKIAAEKSYIAKSGVPIVSQSSEPNVKSIIKARAEEVGAEFIDSSSYEYELTEPACETLGGYVTRFNATIDGVLYDDLALSMLGEHQVRNAITAIATVSRLVKLPETAIREGLLKAKNPGRFEFINDDPVLIIDGAHNPDGIDVAIRTFDTVYKDMDEDRLLVVFGCLSDKESDEMIGKVAKRFRKAHIALAEPNGDRAIPAEELKASFARKGCDCEIIKDLHVLLSSELSKNYDVILTIGSIYLVGDIRTLTVERM